MPVTADRGEIVHLAGHLRLSPALRDGAPALVAPSEVAGRCGWAEFFAVLEGRGLAVSYEPGEGGAITFVPLGARAPRPSWGARARAAFAEARRFVAALRGRPRAS